MIESMQVLDRTRTSVLVKMSVSQYRNLERFFIEENIDDYELVFSTPVPASHLLEHA